MSTPVVDPRLLSIVSIDRELGSRSLREYIKLAWHIVEPSTPFVPGWHLDAISDHLEAVTSGQIRRLLITMPPRSMKSLSVAVFWPTYVWIKHPEKRWLYSSYALHLSVRDSLHCRRVIESKWYQDRWGQCFKLTSDQNQKSRFENDKTGYRIATSVEGFGTGEGGDVIVCLPGEQEITTDSGQVPIGRIVEERLPVRVLGSSGTYQAIEAYGKSPGQPIVNITTTTGTLRCTDNHPVFVVGRGFIPASEVTHADVLLHRLRDSTLQDTGTRSQGAHRTVLLEAMPREVQVRPEQPCMGWRPGTGDMPSLQAAVPVHPDTGLWPSVLFDGMPDSLLRGAQTGTVCALRQDVLLPAGEATVLLTPVCGHGPSDHDTWGAQRSVSARGMELSVHGGLHEEPEAKDLRAGRTPVRLLQRDASLAGSPPRWDEDKPRPGELGHPVHHTPPHGTPEVDQLAVDGCEQVIAISRSPAPAYVYNLRVAPDHDYYASGFLTHNCDDPHNVTDAQSDSMREGVLEWWSGSMSTRGNDPKTVAHVVIMQRLHEADLAGHLLEQGGYEHLCLPAEYEPGRKSTTVLGNYDPRKTAGELLHPGRFGAADIKELKARLGAYGTAGQLQQRPAPLEGGLFKRSWMTRTWTKLPRDDKNVLAMDRLIQSWDTAFKDKDSSDFVVGQVWGRRGPDFWLLDQVRAKMDFPATCLAIKSMTSKWPGCTAKLIEDRSSGTAVIQVLRHQLTGIIPVRADVTTGGKQARAQAIAPLFEAGNVVLPDPVTHSWTGDFIHELCTFPHAQYDDQVDATSQALAYLEPGAYAWTKQQAEEAAKHVEQDLPALRRQELSDKIASILKPEDDTAPLRYKQC